MKVLFINAVCGIRSTGRICADLADQLTSEGHEVKIAYGRGEVPEKYKKYAIRIGSDSSVKVNVLKARILDNEGLSAVRATREFLRWAELFNPDILWLHNIHGYYINYPMLFDWIRNKPQMRVKWTLHDCWSFTGHCAYFTMCGCQKWKTKCENCPQKGKYPTSVLLSRATTNFERKQEAFRGVKDLLLITPSQWLADLTRESILKEYPVEVVNNTIDKTVFRPTHSNFKKKYGITGKMVLGVAAVWDNRKGLEDFLKLAEVRKDVTVVLVGLTKKQLETLPKGIIGISRTNSTKELAEVYSAADVMFLPTKEDNYPTVCLEAEACGTRVVTYDVGGCRETIKRSDSVAVHGFEEAVNVI